MAARRARAGAHTPTVNSVKANVDANVWSACCVVSGAAFAGGVTAPMGVAMGAAALANFINNAVNPDADFMDLTLSPHAFHHHPGDPNHQRELKGARAVNMAIALDAVANHSHTISTHAAQVIPLSGTGTSDPAGVVASQDYNARMNVEPLKYVGNLRLSIDGHDVTENARTQVINNRPTTENWTTFGVLNAPNHAFVEKGTGPIRIDFLAGVVLGEGEHYIDLSVSGAGNGGRVHFNLYLE